MAVDCKLRPKDHKWAGIVIHHTGLPSLSPKDLSDYEWKKLFNGNAKYLQTKDKNYVSAHYIIGRKGERKTLLDPKKYIAWHAGRSKFWNHLTRKWEKGCNNFMLGIELLGDGNLIKYTHDQYEELAETCLNECKRFNIPFNGIVGHETVSPGRKVDPGKYFHWDYFFSLMLK